MKEDILQRTLVKSAQRDADELLSTYLTDKYNKQYYNYVKQMLDAKVLVIPNIQMWVADDYVTNSTVLSLLNMAKEPCSYCQQPSDYEVPADEKNFKDDSMAVVTDDTYYDRYLADCSYVLSKVRGYYPTHTVEIHDFMLALFTMWYKATYGLMSKTREKYRKFFTHHMMNQFMMSLTYHKEEYKPNIKLYAYDGLGLTIQAATWKRWGYTARFKSGPKFLICVTDEQYKKFLQEFIAPLRSIKTVQKDHMIYDMDFKEVEHFNNNTYVNIQGLMKSQVTSIHFKFYDALKQMIAKVPVEDIIEGLGDDVPEQVGPNMLREINRLKNLDKTNYRIEWLDKNLVQMKKKGVNFVKYNTNFNLLPPTKIFSEVQVNMTAFRKQFPTATPQQFTEIYLMAQAINACRRTFVKRYPREKWDLCATIVTGSKEFEYENEMNEINEQLCSDEMENYIGRLK